MAGDTVLTVIGNITADPELRFTPSGAAVANFTVASTPRSYNKDKNEWEDGDTLFLRCSIWRQAAENVAESLSRGTRVIVSGRLKQRSYEKDGEKRTVYEMDVDEVGPSLRNATAKVQKAERQQGQQQGQQQGGDPWASQAQASHAQAQQAQQPAPWGQPQQAPQWGQQQAPTQPGWGAPAQPPSSVPQFDTPPY